MPQAVSPPRPSDALGSEGDLNGFGPEEKGEEMGDAVTGKSNFAKVGVTAVADPNLSGNRMTEENSEKETIVLGNDKGVDASGSLEKITEGGRKDEKKVVEEKKGAGEKAAKKANGSWSAIVQNNPRMKKFDYTVQEVNGVPTIQVPKEVCNSAPLWDDFLIGKFQSQAPFVGKIHILVNKIWPLGDKSVKIDVFPVDKLTVKFRIKDVGVKNRVLRRGMWNIFNESMIITQWSPFAEEMQPEVKTMPLWVVVKNMPRTMYGWDGFSFVTSTIGEPKYLHPNTELCKNLEEGKVFVDGDLTKPLPSQYNFNLISGENVLVTFEYPWLPPRCNECAISGHTSENCSKKKDTVTSPKKSPQKVIIEGENTKEEAKEVPGANQSTLDSVVENVAIGPNLQDKSVENTVKVAEEEEGWSTPPRASKSSGKVTKQLIYGEVSIQQSCFSALFGKGENGEDLEEKQEEKSEVAEEVVAVVDDARQNSTAAEVRNGKNKVDVSNKDDALNPTNDHTSNVAAPRHSSRLSNKESQKGGGNKENVKVNQGLPKKLVLERMFNMSGFVWNIRGFNKLSKQNVMKNWVERNDFDFGCVIETKVKGKRLWWYLRCSLASRAWTITSITDWVDCGSFGSQTFA